MWKGRRSYGFIWKHEQSHPSSFISLGTNKTVMLKRSHAFLLQKCFTEYSVTSNPVHSHAFEAGFILVVCRLQSPNWYTLNCSFSSFSEAFISIRSSSWNQVKSKYFPDQSKIKQNGTSRCLLEEDNHWFTMTIIPKKNIEVFTSRST